MGRIERLPPQNLEAEEGVLGALLINPDAIYRVLTIVKPEDFYREKHQYIFQAALSLQQQSSPIDFLTICDQLEKMGKLDMAGGPAFITSLINATPSSLNAEYYARIVEKKATRRRLIGAAGKIAALAYLEEQDDDTIVDEAEAVVLGVARNRSMRQMKTMSEAMMEYYDHIEELARNPGMYGLPSGFPDIDKITGGFQRSDLILLAGRPSMGKTALALQVAFNAALKYEVNVAVFSLEMSNEQLAERIVSGESGIPSEKLRRGEIADDQWGSFIMATDKIGQVSMFLDDTPGISALELRTKARRLDARIGGLDLIVIDYLQLMRGRSSESRNQEVSEISRDLKALARELDVPVMALSQLSRRVEQRNDKHPLLSDLRDSGTLEQDSDLVMFMYRDEYYNENTERKNLADVIIAKHRKGPTGTASLFFKKELAKFLPAEIRRIPLDFPQEE